MRQIKFLSTLEIFVYRSGFADSIPHEVGISRKRIEQIKKIRKCQAQFLQRIASTKWLEGLRYLEIQQVYLDYGQACIKTKFDMTVTLNLLGREIRIKTPFATSTVGTIRGFAAATTRHKKECLYIYFRGYKLDDDSANLGSLIPQFSTNCLHVMTRSEHPLRCGCRDKKTLKALVEMCAKIKGTREGIPSPKPSKAISLRKLAEILIAAYCKQ